MSGEGVMASVFALVALASAATVALSRRAYGAASPAVAALDIDAICWAIRQVETGDRSGLVGPNGERSAYQFTAATWAQHCPLQFIMASLDPALAERVAQKHLGFVLEKLAVRHLESLPEFVAAAWHFGPDFRLDAARSYYARRVANLYYDRTERSGRR